MSEDITLIYGKGNPFIEKFQMMLNQHPGKSEVKVNKMANNSEYVPIDIIEGLLDGLYNGLWQTENFRTSNIANEIVGSIDLKVFHPVAKEWLTRTGAASVMVQIAKDMPLALENKIKNTLTKDYPHLKAECIKNAAKSLGVRFGRNLNRGQENDFMYLSESVQVLSTETELAYTLLSTAKISDAARVSTEGKIKRANPTTLQQIVKFLTEKQ